MQIFLTGFEPFDHQSINPSMEVIRILEEEKLPGLHTLLLPVEFNQAAAKTIHWLQQNRMEHPEDPVRAVICLGQAGGRKAITPEVAALNLQHAAIADNAGNQPDMKSIDPQGDAAIFSTLDPVQIRDQIKKQEIPCELSFHAGTYVCNDLLYQVLNYARKEDHQLKAVFIHLPWLPEQARAVHKKNPELPEPFSLSLNEMVQAVNSVLEMLEEKGTAEEFI